MSFADTESSMQGFLNFCIVTAVIVMIALVLYAIVRLIRLLRKILLLQQTADNPGTPNAVCRLLEICYPRFPRFADIPLPYQTKDGRHGVCHVELAVVNRGGILLITTCPQCGFIENPFHGYWRQFHKDDVVSFPNPLEQNTAKARILTELLRNAGRKNIPIRAIAVFPCERNRYKNRIEQVMPLSALSNYVHDMNKNRFLSDTEIRQVSKMLRRLKAR